MKKIYKLNLKSFFKSRHISAAFFISLAVCIIYLIYEIVNMHRYNYNEPMHFLRTANKLGIYAFILFSFLSFEYISTPQNVYMNETISTIYHGKLKMNISRLMVLLIPICIFSIIVFLLNAALYALADIHYGVYFVHIIKNIILNIFFVSVIGGLLGAILGLKLKRMGAYSLIALIAFCISPGFQPFAEEVGVLTSSFSKPLNIFPIWDGIRILAPDTEWATDNVYGFSIEACRWNLALFWTLALGTIYIVKTDIKRKTTKAICLALALVAVANFAGFIHQGSIVRKDTRPNGFSYPQADYAQTMTDDIQQADFTVLAYDMVLDVKRELNADVAITFETYSDIDVYSFTLYRGYKVKKVTDEAGNELQYERNEDFLDIINDFGDGLAKIHIEYKGHGEKYVSNRQGLALMGYFPYYPMEGHLKIWDGNNIVANTDFPKKKFKVKVNFPLNIVSNLEKQGNVFEGISTTATFVGGMIIEEDIDGVTFAHSPFIEIGTFSVEDIDKQWSEIQFLIGEERAFDIKGKKIILGLNTLFLSGESMYETQVIFNDHVTGLYFQSSSICGNYLESLIPYSNGKLDIKGYFYNYLFQKESLREEYNASKETYEKYVSKQNNENSSDEEGLDNFILKHMAGGNLFLYKIDELGESYTLKKVYEYLLDTENNTEQLEFLYNLD